MGGMMKLYFSNGSCSLASHITLEESGAKFEAQRIDLRAGDQKKPEFLALNPKGKVPTIVVDGTPITENPAIMSYIADTNPQANLLPKPGDLGRAKAQGYWPGCASTDTRPSGRSSAIRTTKSRRRSCRRTSTTSRIG